MVIHVYLNPTLLSYLHGIRERIDCAAEVETFDTLHTP